MSGPVASRYPTPAGIWQLVLSGAVLVGCYVLEILTRHWLLVAFLTLVVLATILIGLRSKTMQLNFDVGTAERHEVVFRLNKFWGTVNIDVDHELALRDVSIFSIRLTKKYFVSVGAAERHEIRIEKDRSLAFAGVRRQTVRVYVDNILVAEAVA